MPSAYIALGSNLGDRARNLLDGVRLVLDRVEARARISPLYETAPVGYVDQPPFLNGVLDGLGPGNSYGGPLWLPRHYEAWLTSKGRVPPPPAIKQAAQSPADAFMARQRAKQAGGGA